MSMGRMLWRQCSLVAAVIMALSGIIHAANYNITYGSGSYQNLTFDAEAGTGWWYMTANNAVHHTSGDTYNITGWNTGWTATAQGNGYITGNLGGTGTVTVQSRGSGGTGGYINNLTMTGTVNITGNGNMRGSNTVTGNFTVDGTGRTGANVNSNSGSSMTVVNGNASITNALLAGNTRIVIDSGSTVFGDITFTNSEFGDGASGIGNENLLQTVRGKITVSSSTFGTYTNVIHDGDNGQIEITATTVGNNSSIIQNGDGGQIELRNTSLGNFTNVTSNGDDAVIDVINASGGAATTIQVNGERGEVNLSGSATRLAGSVQLTGDDAVANIAKDHGEYALVENLGTGAGTVNVSGGHIIDIQNNTTGTGKMTVNLLDHANTAGGAYDQAVKNITGKIGADDEVEISKDVRYSEYGSGIDNATAGGDSAKLVNAQLDSMTDIALLTMNSGSAIEIGTRDTTTAGQFKVTTVDMVGTSLIDIGNNDLYLHRTGLTPGTLKHQIDTIFTAKGSTIWIDRSTVTSVGSTGTQLTMVEGSTLTGYMDRNGSLSTDVNIEGDVTVENGALLKPYMLELYDPTFKTDTSLVFAQALTKYGVGMKIGEVSAGVGGNLTMNAGALYDIRIFEHEDSTYSITTNQDIPDTLNIRNSDWVEANAVTFTGQAMLNPTFGNDNEIGAKLDFKVYTGDGTDNTDTYYYSVLRGSTITYAGATGVMIDDNTMFNNQIIKSDMLGEWNFEMNSTGDEVLLRFRLLAKHPLNGGIAIDMVEPNAAAAARQIDRIRYPVTIGDRYDGNMKAAYEADPSLYPNYTPEYIADFEDLLLNIQNIIGSGAVLNEAMRRLHPEPYADLANINLGIMDQFVRTREQHGMSSLFQVESRIRDDVANRIEGNSQALASLEDFGPGLFVKNPARIWAAGFGVSGRQNKKGTEYGFDSEVWGGAVGIMKEWGDFYGGVSGGYARVKTDWDDLRATASTDTFIADALIGLRFGYSFLELYGNYAYADHEMSRDLNFANYIGHAKGTYHDNVWGAGMRYGYQLLLGNNFLFVPTIGVNYVISKSGSFTEAGRAGQSILLDFNSGGIKRQNVRVPVTARLNRSFGICGNVVTPEVRASFTPVFGDKKAKATARFVGDPSAAGHFTAVGIDNGRWSGQVGGSLELSRRGRLNITGNYDYTFRKKSHEHNYSLMAGINF